MGRAGAGGHKQGDRSAACLRRPLNSNMAAVFKQDTAEGRRQPRGLGRGCGAPPLIFQLIYWENSGPILPHTDTCWRLGEGGGQSLTSSQVKAACCQQHWLQGQQTKDKGYNRMTLRAGFILFSHESKAALNWYMNSNI